MSDIKITEDEQDKFRKELAEIIKPLFQEEQDPNTWPLPVDRILLYTYLQERMNSPFNLTYQNLYLVLPAVNNEEFAAEFTILADKRFPDVPSGELMIFFVKRDAFFWRQFPAGVTPKLLNRDRFPYPSISQIKQRKN